jgi:Lon protease-like protein
MELPLFPLHSVLAPGIVLPLHVFEPRYRALARRCLARDEPFGVVWIRDGREVGAGTMSLATVGTMAEIRESRETDDGRYELLAAGTRRFHVGAVEADREPYLVGHVEPLDEPIGDPARAADLTWIVLRRFARYLRLLEPADGEVGVPIDVRIEVDAEGDESALADAAAGGPGAEPSGLADLGSTIEPEATIDVSELEDRPTGIIIPDDPTVLSHLLSGILQVEPVRRQALLEAETAEARLAALVELLGRELQLLGSRLRVFSAEPPPVGARRN